jgi:uncharacterized protein YjbI with pentapeptide repeats
MRREKLVERQASQRSEPIAWRARDAKTQARDREARDEAVDLIKVSNQDVSQTRNELLFFLAALLFVSITTLSITDRDLLYGSRVQLPIFGLAMSFDAFLLGAPILLIAIHYPLLLRLSRVRAKLLTLNSRIEEASDADGLIARTSSNFLIHWLIKPAGSRLYRFLSSFIYVTAACLAPVLTLMLITVRTLPLHSAGLTGLQVFILSADIGLLALFHWGARRQIAVAFGAGLGVWVFASLVLCLPDGLFDRVGRRIWPSSVPFGIADSKRVAFLPTAFLLENGIDNATGRPILFFSRNLIVADDLGWQGATTSSSKSQVGDTTAGRGANFRGRDLRYAILDRSNFRGADFSLANLTGASLIEANLSNARFGCAAEDVDVFDQLWNLTAKRAKVGRWLLDNANCTVFDGARLDRADMRSSKFEQGQFRKPRLTGVSLVGTILDEADLSAVDLSLASLVGASLVSANMRGAVLIGADLTGATLLGANLAQAELRLAALGSSRLDGANLYEARLIGADLSGASLFGTNMNAAALNAATFKGAFLWGSQAPTVEKLAWADLSETDLSPPSPWQIAFIKNKSLEARQLQQLVDLVERSKEDFGSNKYWQRVKDAIASGRDDVAYRRAVIAIISDDACTHPEVLSAVELWSRPNYGSYDLYTYEPRTVPPAPSDPLLSSIKDDHFSDFGSVYGGEYSPDTVVPLPQWYDVDSLVARIDGNDCPSAKLLDDRLIADLRAHALPRRIGPLPKAKTPQAKD